MALSKEKMAELVAKARASAAKLATVNTVGEANTTNTVDASAASLASDSTSIAATTIAATIAATTVAGSAVTVDVTVNQEARKQAVAEMVAVARAKAAARLMKIKQQAEPVEEANSAEQQDSTELENAAQITVVVDSATGMDTQQQSHLYDENSNRIYITATGKEVVLNSAQEEFVTALLAGESIVLIGKAGTGKTTTAGVGMTEMIKAGKILPMSSGTDHLRSGLPGVAITSFTNKAVNNIRKQMPLDLQPHCLTIHKLLEYKPKYFEITDPSTGLPKITMRFEPTKNAFNPLPGDLRLIVIEESSMVDIDLHQKLVAALPAGCQIVYLGDIRQLPPVFGSAILGFKMLELRVIELTEVYRQALLSPILRAALAVDDGKFNLFNPDSKIKNQKTGKWEWPLLQKWNESTEHGTLKIHPWQKNLSADMGLMTAIKFMNTLGDAGPDQYNPEEDIILCPFNKAFGTIELNKGISQHLGRKRGATVYEIIAGFEKHYLAVGDRVLYAKDDAFITDICFNTDYMGKRPQPASTKLNRWGHYDETMSSEELEIAKEISAEADLAAIEYFLEAATDQIENRVAAASHVVTLRVPGVTADEWTEVSLESASDINDLLGGYAITVHKAQGSEYNKVFGLLHNSHNTMLSRELLYTLMTRAKQHLYMICEPDSIQKGIKSQRIKGNTLAEKAEFFKGKIDQYKALVGDDPEEFARIAEIKEKCAAALIEAVDKLCAAYPNKPRIEIKEVTYIDNGSAAGMAQIGAGIVNLNPLYIKWDFSHILQNTIPHEVAHIAAASWFEDYSHGTAWKQLCKEAGGNGSIYHESGSAKTLRGRKA